MKFLVQNTHKISEGSLVYREEDYSFDIEPLEYQGFTSGTINDLQLEIDSDRKIIYVWGFCPLINYYEETTLTPSNYMQANLIA